MNIRGKTVLLVGASGGIGKSIAKSMIDLGASVIVFGIHKPDFKCEFYEVDITKEETKRINTECDIKEKEERD